MVIFISLLVLVTFGKIPIHGFLFLQQVVEVGRGLHPSLFSCPISNLILFFILFDQVDKLERLFEKSGEEMLSREFCRKIALSFT